ncbi:MAG: T9SS type A sorting domain-containing protein [Bacteroidales bacterium]|nr:T9SS type A sorting domain-containing protein [Bacteroidales bacterium]
MKNSFLLLLLAMLSTQVYSQPEIAWDDDGNSPSQIEKKTYSSETYSYQKSGNEWESIGPFGGDVLDLAMDPTNPEKAFAAAGFPYSRTGLADNWHIIEGLSTLSPSGIQSIEANASGLLFAGGIYSYGKVYLSTDGGDTWVQKNLPMQGGVNDIAVDPSNPDKIYLALSSNLSVTQNKVIVKSENAGTNWTAIDMTTWLPVGWGCVSLAVDPADSLTIVAIGNESFSNAKVLITTDGGLSWQDISNGLPVGKPYNTATINNGVIYVTGGQLFGGQVMGVYKSENYGSSWQNMSAAFPNKVANDILIHPDDDNIMYVATEGDGIYVTTDGGANWTYNTNGAGDNGSARSLLFKPDNPDVVLAGFLSLGVCVTEDAGVSWESSTKGIASLSLNDIEIDPNNPDIVLAGFEAENSGGCYLKNGEDWEVVSGLPGTRFSQVSIGIDGTMYAWSNGPTTVGQEGVYKSTDGGTTWTNMGPNIGSVFETQIFAMALSDLDPDIIFIAGNNFGANGWASMIYRSTDGGATWENVFMGPENDGFKYIHIDPNSSDLVVYAAYKTETAGAGFIKSIDGGSSWLPINDDLPASAKWAGAIISDPTNSNILYGGLGGYGGINGTVYRSEDAGSSWVQTNISLSSYSKATDFLISPMDSNVVYLATTSNGVYLTEDGENWSAANDGLPASNVTGFSRAYQDIEDNWVFMASSFTNSAFATMVWQVNTTGLSPFDDHKRTLNVFPNPTKNGLFLDIPVDINNPIQATIIHPDGRANIQNPEVIRGKAYINTDNLSPGIYFIHLDVNQFAYTGKFIISK